VLSPLSSHTSARKPVGKQFDRKPTQQSSRHIWSPPTGNLRRYDNRRNATTILNHAHMCVIDDRWRADL